MDGFGGRGGGRREGCEGAIVTGYSDVMSWATLGYTGPTPVSAESRRGFLWCVGSVV